MGGGWGGYLCIVGKQRKFFGDELWGVGGVRAWREGWNYDEGGEGGGGRGGLHFIFAALGFKALGRSDCLVRLLTECI